MKYILASGSPRRKELLALTGLPFGICVPKVQEIITPNCPAGAVAEHIAAQKAAYVAKQFPEDCIIGADTVVVIDGEILGKPKDAADAARMLRLLSGREHKVITGVCLSRAGAQRTFSQETRVLFYVLDDEEIERYVHSGEPMDKAGAYGIQGKGALLAESIAGDYFNVVGLPVARLARELKAFLVK